MSKYEYDIGVIGGGATGLTVSSGSAQLGAKTILLEQEEKLGGDCLHYGCVPSKTLIHAADAYHSLLGMDELGLPVVERSPVNFSRVSGRIQSVIDTIQVHDSVERFNRLGVEVAFGVAEFAGSHSVKIGARTVTAKKWLVGTGSSPFIPKFEGSEYCLTNREIFSLSELPEHLVVLGGGPVGIEMAQAFVRLGSKVSLIQRSGQILSREDKDLADIVMQSLASEGIEFYLEHTVEKISKQDRDFQLVIVDKQKKQKKLSSSHVLAAYGRVPNVKSLLLDKAGIQYHDKGIPVDARLRTNVKHIYAAGDVLGKYQFTHAAGYEGGIVITNAVMGLPRKVNYQWMPRCTYSDPEFAVVGKTEKELHAEGHVYSVWTEDFKNNDRAQAEAAVTGKIKLLLSSKGKPLGVHIVGRNAGDLLAEWIAVVNGKLKLSTLAGAIHAYPTQAEINKRVVGQYFSEKLFSDKMRKALKIIHRYQGSAV